MIQSDSQIAIMMEYCEGGSLDAIYRRIKQRQGRTGEKVLGKVAEAVCDNLIQISHAERSNLFVVTPIYRSCMD